MEHSSYNGERTIMSTYIKAVNLLSTWGGSPPGIWARWPGRSLKLPWQNLPEKGRMLVIQEFHYCS